jgi:hypothetical protein
MLSSQPNRMPMPWSCDENMTVMAAVWVGVSRAASTIARDASSPPSERNISRSDLARMSEGTRHRTTSTRSLEASPDTAAGEAGLWPPSDAGLTG